MDFDIDIPNALASTPAPAPAPAPDSEVVKKTPWEQASEVFNPQVTQAQLQQSPVIQQLKQMQEIAARRASNAVKSGMAQSGFGLSSFAPQAQAQAATQAHQGYLGQIAQTGQQIQDTQQQNFMKLLGLLSETDLRDRTLAEEHRANLIREGYQGEELALRQRQFEEQLRAQREAEQAQRRQQQSNDIFGIIRGFGALAAAPATGGASLALM